MSQEKTCFFRVAVSQKRGGLKPGVKKHIPFAIQSSVHEGFDPVPGQSQLWYWIPNALVKKNINVSCSSRSVLVFHQKIEVLSEKQQKDEQKADPWFPDSKAATGDFPTNLWVDILGGYWGNGGARCGHQNVVSFSPKGLEERKPRRFEALSLSVLNLSWERTVVTVDEDSEVMYVCKYIYMYIFKFIYI